MCRRQPRHTLTVPTDRVGGKWASEAHLDRQETPAVNIVIANPDPDRPPRNRAEATEQLGAAKALDPARADRYRLWFNAGGWNVVRRDP